MKRACMYQIGSGLKSLRKQAYKKFDKSILSEDGGEGKSTLLQAACAGGAFMAHKKEPFFQNVM